MQDAVRIVLDVAAEDDGERLDRWISSRVADISRSYAQNLVRAGNVYVNGEVAKPARRVHTGDRVEILLPPVEAPPQLTPAYVPVPIVYEDEDIIVFDKPAGMVTHPAPRHEHGTLVHALKALRPDLKLTPIERPGVVHRLDKDTSGLIVVAKNDAARRFLLKQWQERDVVKRYLALVHGVIPEEEGTINAPISRDLNNRKRMGIVASGRPAISHFRVLERFPEATLLLVTIETGRTHQIRVHLNFIGHPVVGDQLYGKRPFKVPVPRQFLHATYLKFALPESGQPIEVETPLPQDLAAVLNQLGAESA